MRRFRIALLAVCIAVAGVGIWLTRAKPTSAYAATAAAAPTPGQLSVVDKNGKTTALCPLRHTDVVADVSGFVARVTVKQQFEGPGGSGPVEAIYTFPLPEDAAVDSMTMVIGGTRVVKGQIKRREDARAIYDAARANGQTAALLDQERANIFTQSVANLMPGEKIDVTISYVALLKYDEGKYTFAFPMVVGPRFVGAGTPTGPNQRGTATARVPDADKITPPITPPNTRSGHDISLTVNLDAGLPVGQIESRLHDVDVRRSGRNRATIRLRDQNAIPNKDFILRYTAAGSEVQEGILTHASSSGKSGYFTLILQPPSAPRRDQVTSKEMVFVIDQTGSQMGEPIKKAKETMRYCIQNLNPGDTFQLLGFNTEVFPCFPAPVPATPENIQTAQAYLAKLEAAGGTDILKAADYALKIPDDPARLRIICYMTDGYVGDDRQIIAHIRANRGRARMFPFGIGNSVNRFLIEGMAREGAGVADIVDLNTPGETAASKFYRRVADPLLTNITIDWGGLSVVDTYPKAIPDVFSAAPIIVKGRYAKTGSGDITIRGLLRGKPWTRTVHVDLPAQTEGNAALPTLWAREKIEGLSVAAWSDPNTMGAPKEQITAVALEYGLMSEYTSFVAVEQRVVNVGGKPRRIDVPVEMPDGVSSDGIFGKSEESLGQAQSRYRATLGRSLALSAPMATAKAMPGGVGGGAFGGGGFGGGVGGGPASNALAASPAVPALREKSKQDRLSTTLSDQDVELKRLSPVDRAARLRDQKLASNLKPIAIKGGPARETIQIWLDPTTLTADAVAKLKALGFELSATLTPKKLLLGTLPAAKLNALIALPWVRYVESPQLK